MKMEELLSKLNKESKQNEFLEEDNSIWNILDLVEAKEVETGLDVDKHRWYERTTTVFEVKCDDNKKLPIKFLIFFLTLNFLLHFYFIVYLII